MQNANPALVRTTPLVLIVSARPFRVEQTDGLGNEYPESLTDWASLPVNYGTAVADHGDTIEIDGHLYEINVIVGELELVLLGDDQEAK